MDILLAYGRQLAGVLTYRSKWSYYWPPHLLATVLTCRVLHYQLKQVRMADDIVDRAKERLYKYAAPFFLLRPLISFYGPP